MEPLIIYIIADVRSGSTLLDYLLSFHPNALTLGEVHHLKGFYFKEGIGITYNYECSCGEKFNYCPFWKPILNDLNIDKNFETRITKAKSFKLNDPFLINRIKAEIDCYESNKSGQSVAENCWKIYEKVLEHSDKTILIDSSKDPLEAYFRNKFKKHPIKFIVLERDILEVSFSKKYRGREISKFTKKAGYSIYRNLFGSLHVLKRIRVFKRLINNSVDDDIIKTIDYKDLTENPQKTINEICEFLNIEKFKVPDVTNSYKTKPHILCGSQSRFNKQKISPDNRWKKYYKSNPLALIFGKMLKILG